MEPVETAWIETVAAYCRWATTQLPSGELGAATAVDVLQAFPEVCRRGVADTTVSAPDFFALLVSLGIRSSVPSDRTMPASLRLVAAVCPLIGPRSPRRFTAWFGAAGDPASSLAAEIRARVTPAMLVARAEVPPRARPIRLSIRADRDRLAVELRDVEEQLAQSRAREAELDAQRLAAWERIEVLERRAGEHEQRYESQVAKVRVDAELRLAEAERMLGSVVKEAQEGLLSSASQWKAIAADYEARIEREQAKATEHAQALEQARSEAEELRRERDLARSEAAARAGAEVKCRDLEAQLASATLELETSRYTLMSIREWVRVEPGDEVKEIQDLVLRSNAHDETIEAIEQERDRAEEELEQERILSVELRRENDDLRRRVLGH